MTMKNLEASISTKAQKLDNAPFHTGHRLIISMCGRMRIGQETKISTLRINQYVQSIWKMQLLSYFNFEQKWIFPHIPNPKDTRQLIRQHEKIRRMMEQKNVDFKSLNRLEEYLEMHVRFESKIQVNLSQARAVQIRQQLPEIAMQHWSDKFWLITANKE